MTSCRHEPTNECGIELAAVASTACDCDFLRSDGSLAIPRLPSTGVPTAQAGNCGQLTGWPTSRTGTGNRKRWNHFSRNRNGNRNRRNRFSRTLDGPNRAIVIAESLATVIAAIRIASFRWSSYLPPKHYRIRSSSSSHGPCVHCAAIRIARLAFIGVVFIPRGTAEWFVTVGRVR